jgi:tetraacyldisaccharide 4'-kinase
MELKTKISKIHYDKKNRGILFNVLFFLSFFYKIGSDLKNFLYDNKILTPQKVRVKVISVGNLTTGGVGKTPYVSELVKQLKFEGKNPAIISRGYGGTLSGVNVISDGKEIFYTAQEAGDEPYMLSQVTQAVVITSPIRYEGAKLAIEKFKVDVIVLDDGFQHRKFYRDEDIILIDSEKQFGNDKMLPAGPLRESLNGIKRADKIVIVSKNISHYKAYDYAENLREKYKKPVSVCKIEPDKIYNLFDEADSIQKNQQVIAFSGIGQPQQFYNFLKNYDVIKTFDFNDHHSYSQNDIEKLESYNLPLVTTEKDAVKLKGFKFTKGLYVLKLKIQIEDIK